MKRLSTFIVSLATTMLLSVSCDALNSVSKKDVTAQGAPYELIVVSNQPEWEGALGDTLQKVFKSNVKYLLQPEPIFDILRITESGYNGLVMKHRNILDTNINPALTESSASVQYDLRATPQIVVTVEAPSAEELTKYISENREKLISVFEDAEANRIIEHTKKFNVPSLNKLVSDKFDFNMLVPNGYTLRSEADNFLWLSYEYPSASQGIFIYSYAATEGAKSLSEEDLIAARNKFAANIPGPAEGSYMTTFDEYAPDYRTFRLDGRLWAELRGMWEVEGDFMGGPFVSYSTINTATGEVVTIDCYVYSPRLAKRNFIRELEQVIHNVSFE